MQSYIGYASPSELTKVIGDEELYDTFPDVAIALCIFICLMVSNCSSERSFSRMALIKSKLRSTMTGSRLSVLHGASQC
jgi:hypothetical protein